MRAVFFALACLASTARRVHRTATRKGDPSRLERRVSRTLVESLPCSRLLTDFNDLLSSWQLRSPGLPALLKSLAINFLAFNSPASGCVTGPSSNVVGGEFIHVKLKTCTDSLPALDNMASTSTKLMLNSAAAVVPNPEQADRQYDLEPHCGGEDAFFIDDAAGVLGVADGVGGWSCRGVDPGIFSRQLMRFAADEASRGNVDPHDVLQHAHARTTALGSSTALILSLVSQSAKRMTPTRIDAANLGDSGFLIMRHGEVLFQSEPQQHSFNLPFQLAMPDLTGTDGDDPRQAQKIVIENIEEGDLLILGTDGLFDNAFGNEIAEIVRYVEDKGPQFLPTAVAEELAKQTSLWALDEQRKSPFEEESAQEGTPFPGGKLDDITVVVAQVIRSPGADDAIVAKT